VIHRGELAVLQPGLEPVIGRRAREAGGEGGFASLDQLDRPSNLLHAAGCRQDLVVVLLAAEAAAEHVFVHIDFDVLWLLVEQLDEVGGKRHAGKRGALGAGMDVPGAVHELDRRVERLHRGVAHHVGGVLHLQHLLGPGEPLVDVALQHPVGAGLTVASQLRELLEDVGEVELAVGPGIDLDLERLGGLHRGGKRLGERHHPAGALADPVVDLHGLDEAGDLLCLGVIDPQDLGAVARARNGECAVHHVGEKHVDRAIVSEPWSTPLLRNEPSSGTGILTISMSSVSSKFCWRVIATFVTRNPATRTVLLLG
jgi:hypothetical protein